MLLNAERKQQLKQGFSDLCCTQLSNLTFVVQLWWNCFCYRIRKASSPENRKSMEEKESCVEHVTMYYCFFQNTPKLLSMSPSC